MTMIVIKLKNNNRTLTDALIGPSGVGLCSDQVVGALNTAVLLCLWLVEANTTGFT
jgi:hypothetical protein